MEAITGAELWLKCPGLGGAIREEREKEEEGEERGGERELGGERGKREER